MKRGLFIALFLFMIALSAFSVACSSSPKAKEYTDLEVVHQWVKKNVSRTVVNQLVLPTTCEEVENCEISWSSSDPKIIDNTGAVVTRPEETTKVDLTYSIKIGKKLVKEFVLGVYVSSQTLEEVEEEFLSLIPEQLSKSIAIPNVFANGAVEVIIESSNTDVLKASGDFKQPNEDVNVTLNYIITDGNDEITGTVETFAKAKSEEERLANTVEWLNCEGFNELLLNANTVFPTEYEEEDTRIYWEASNLNLFVDGKIVQSVYKRHITMIAHILADNEYHEVQYFCEIEPVDTSAMSEAEYVEALINTVAVEKYYKLSFNQDGSYHGPLEPYNYPNISQSYGFINFFGTIEYDFFENWIPEGRGNRPGDLQPGGTQYIAIHDTAGTQSSSTAYNNSHWCTNPDNSTSWHYTVDATSVYQQLPTNEIAYHAGDGRTRYFAMLDTGLKATSALPVITLKDGYFHINGIRTSITPYVLDVEDRYKDHNIPIQAEINQQGVLCEIGENGNYYLGKTYLNSDYNLIANYGGNTNSIGIESCVNAGADYAMTARNFALLVARLMIENDLEINRVRGHHYFSGKPCPNAILLAGWWSEFLDLIVVTKLLLEEFSEYTFEWTSLSDNLSETGMINKKCSAGDEISYSVKVSKGTSLVFEKTYKTILA